MVAKRREIIYRMSQIVVVVMNTEAESHLEQLSVCLAHDMDCDVSIV